MKSQAVQFQGKTYCYILSLLDVFPRFHWLCPLQTKHSRRIKENIKKILLFTGCQKRFNRIMGKNSKGKWSDSAEWKRCKWSNLDHTIRGRKEKWSSLIVSWEMKYPLTWLRKHVLVKNAYKISHITWNA